MGKGEVNGENGEDGGGSICDREMVVLFIRCVFTPKQIFSTCFPGVGIRH